MIYRRILTMAVIGVFLIMIVIDQSTSQPSSGDVRLVGATFSNVTGGRVEIYHNGAWGTVCDDYWDINEGKVVCKQLGFTDAIQVYSNAYFGRGSGTIWMHNIQCNGTEAKLEDCPHNGWGTTSCSHYEDAGVSCQPFHLNSTSNTGNCSFETGTNLCGYTNLHSDDFDWTLTSSSYYRYYLPRSDHTTGYGHYLSIASSYLRYTGSKAQITSPLLKDVKCVHFYYFMKGSRVGQLNMYVNVGSNNKTLLWQNVGPQAAVWIKAIVPIKGFSSEFRIMFEGVIGGRYAADIAIDDIVVFKTPCVYNTTGNCTFEPGVMCGYTNADDNVNKWVLHKGRSYQYSSIGPFRDHTTGNGYYALLNPRSSIRGRISQLVSPETYGSHCVQFYYFMHTSSGELSVYIDDGVKRLNVWQLIGSEENQWKFAGIPVNRSTKAFKVVFEVLSGGSMYRNRIAIDDISIVNNQSCKLLPSAASVKPIDIHSIKKDVRLAGGHSNSSGRVEVFYKGRWGTICGYNFPLTSARVICRQLGFPDVFLVMPCCSLFHAGKGRILLQDVMCRGQEPDIKMCSHRGWGISTCSHSQDLGIICKSKLDGFNRVRLNGSSHDYEGRAEVQFGGLWGTIRDSGWDIYDGDVFCREVGFKGASEVYNHAHHGQGSGPVWIRNTECTGNEKSFWNCNLTTVQHVYSYWYWNSHYRDASVKCYDLKLTGGKTKNEGILLIRWEGTWGTICNDGWDMKDAHVACRNLGFLKAKSTNLSYRAVVPKNKRSLLSQFECHGNEPSLASCRRRSLALVSHQCTHDNDAVVVCDSTPITPSTIPTTTGHQSAPSTTPITKGHQSGPSTGTKLTPTRKPDLMCTKSEKHGTICVCNKEKTTKCYALGTDVNFVSLELNNTKWNPDKFKAMLAKQLTEFCTNHSCGQDSSFKDHYESRDVIIINSTTMHHHDRVNVYFMVFDSHTMKPIRSSVFTVMIAQDKLLGGLVVSLHHSQPHSRTPGKSHPNVIMMVGIALGVLIFFAVVIFAFFYRTKQKRRLRALVRYHVPGSPAELNFTDDEEDANEDDRLLALDDDQAPLLPPALTVVA